MYGQSYRQNINGEIVEVRYPIEIRKDKCAMCKQRGVFICEHNTSIRDMIHSTYVQEGRFYLDPRKPKNNISNDIEKNGKFEKNKVIPSDNITTQNKVEIPVPSEASTEKKNDKKNSSCCTII
ncbi:hypothetical protein BpHYR1_046167 [Brachionus plicatilis]|uniref:Uncharacterized protein n=1 Tax=Brachionus plicatilis TaxID=10195 RepID=A0A3M7QCC7_BRAPC|nr:hypothetical protein BpHYR1_046167 [Brachionus plicatilis]